MTLFFISAEPKLAVVVRLGQWYNRESSHSGRTKPMPAKIFHLKRGGLIAEVASELVR